MKTKLYNTIKKGRKGISYIIYLLSYPVIRIKSNRKGTILSLYFHNPTKESFEGTVKWLLNHNYKFAEPQDVIDFVNGQNNTKKLVWISFDDGWKNNYYDIFPIIKKYNVKVTFFISTKGISDGYYWFNHVREKRKTFPGGHIDFIWKSENSERIEIIKNLPSYNGCRTAMNKIELKDMSSSDLITLGNHTHDHVICSNCSNEELSKEICLFENYMNSHIEGKFEKVFAYPNGNLNNDNIEVLKKLGYKMAASTIQNNIRKGDNIYKIPRYGMTDNASYYENIIRVFGFWDYVNKAKKALGITINK